MVWIKRNLFFALSALTGLVLMAGAGWFFYSNWDANRAAIEDLKTAQAELDSLQKKNLTPAQVQEAKDSQVEMRKLLEQFKTVFAPAPEVPAVDEKTFKGILDKTISQLQSSASNYGVRLIQPDYAFSFGGQTAKLNFPTNCIGPWMVQLQEIKNISGVLFNAKVNTLESIHRAAVSADEVAAGAADFLTLGSVTNDMIVRTPYEVVVQGYSREIADMMNGFLRSTNCFIVKNIDIGPTSGVMAAATSYGGGSAVYRTGDPPGRNRGRGGIVMRSTPTPALDASVNPLAPTTLVSEGLLRVVVLLEIVKPIAH